MNYDEDWMVVIKDLMMVMTTWICSPGAKLEGVRTDMDVSRGRAGSGADINTYPWTRAVRAAASPGQGKRICMRVRGRKQARWAGRARH
jgi:hypothetical protein